MPGYISEIFSFKNPYFKHFYGKSGIFYFIKNKHREPKSK